MIAHLPLFPLNIVVFPQEKLALHIFEPRYKDLINDCVNNNTNFGIPSFVNQRIALGTEVKIREINKKYDDGRMDITVDGLSPFMVDEFLNPWNNEVLYAGGDVTYLEEDEMEADTKLFITFKQYAENLFNWLGETKGLILLDRTKKVFDIAHKIGFKPEEEYHLLELRNENERLEYGIKHLERLLPALKRARMAQDRILQNGHFKNLDPLRF